jgi:hypothetical protein
MVMMASVLYGGTADLVLKNGIVITMEASQPKATAIAIGGDKILWIGDSSKAQTWIGPKTKVVDLEGAFVYPGFIDSHAHVTGLGDSRTKLDLVGTPDKQSVVKMVQEATQTTPKGEWIRGRGWDQNDWPEKKFPSAADLDPITPENPVVLLRVDGHAHWVNTAALRLAGITKDTKDPEGGLIERDADGNPTGILVDNAMDLLDAAVPTLTQQQVQSRIQIALQEASGKGITMIHDAGESETQIEAFKALAASGRLPVRVYGMIGLPDPYCENLVKDGPKNFGPFYELRSVKLYEDGALGSRGAALLAPYSDDPANSGLMRMTEDQLLPLLMLAKKGGFQVGVHAIGDRANRLVLDAYSKMNVNGLRWRIEHAQVLSQSDIPRLALWGVIASMQPTHATSDMPWAEDRVGPDRIKGAYAWQSLLQHKTVIAGGSDAPVEDCNPLWGIYAAITRQDHDGLPKGGWHPEQSVSREEALRMFTIDGAYAAFRENELGSLKVGKLADLTVLPKNLLTCDPHDMIDMKVTYTIVGGQLQH